MDTSRIRVARLGLSLLLFPVAIAASGAPADATYLALRNAKPDGKAVSVRQLVLERDAFRFKFESGAFQFLSSVGGRPFGAVFSGQATLELRPSTEGERRYLAFVTGEKGLEVLSESFSSLVLFFTDGTATEIEKQGSPAAAVPDAPGLYQAAFKRQRTDWKSNLQIRLLADALRPGKAGGVFLALLSGKKYPSALLAVDPEGLEWLFSGVGNEGSAMAVLQDSEPRLWYSAKAKALAADAGADVSATGIQALHYAVETSIKSSGQIDATTTIRLEAFEDGIRVVPLHLMEKLRLQEASFAPMEGDAWTPVAFTESPPAEESSNARVDLPSPRSQQLVDFRVARGMRNAFHGRPRVQEGPS